MDQVAFVVYATKCFFAPKIAIMWQSNFGIINLTHCPVLLSYRLGRALIARPADVALASRSPHDSLDLYH